MLFSRPYLKQKRRDFYNRAAFAKLQRDYPQLTLRPFPGLAELVKAIKEGRVFAGFHGELQINYYMRQHSETAIYIGLDPEAPYPSDIRIAVRPDAPNLLHWVNIYLANHVGQQDASELIERYAGLQSGED